MTSRHDHPYPALTNVFPSARFLANGSYVTMVSFAGGPRVRGGGPATPRRSRVAGPTPSRGGTLPDGGTRHGEPMGGFSAFGGWTLTGWRPDPVVVGGGCSLFLRDKSRSDPAVILFGPGLSHVAAVTSGSDQSDADPCDADRSDSDQSGSDRRASDRSASEATRIPWRRTPGVLAIQRRCLGLDIELEIAVCPEAPVEVRRLTLWNRTATSRALDITSYAEVVLNDAAAHRSHPAFSKLFVQTESAGLACLLARRRPRNPGESPPWLFHAANGLLPEIEHETDRVRFIERGRTLADARALESGAKLSGTTGNVLDPIVSLRGALNLEPGARRQVVFVLGAGAGRDAALERAALYNDPTRIDKLFKAARSREEELLRTLGMSAEELERAEDLAGRILLGDPSLRVAPAPDVRAQSPVDLEELGIDADRPFVLAHAAGSPGAPSWLLRAHAWWKAQGIRIDLVVVAGAGEATSLPTFRAAADSAPRVVALDASHATVRHLEALASCVVGEARGEVPAASLELAQPSDPHRPNSPEHARLSDSHPTDPPTRHSDSHPTDPPTRVEREEPLRFDNGIGGFSEDGREYVIRLRREERLAVPPMPWINVVSNEQMGFLVSETGAGCTWTRNSREHRITPWHNDPLLDPHGEALYIRDEHTGRYWSPLPGPIPGRAGYEVRHGFGYSRFRHVSEGLEQETLLTLDAREAIRKVELRITNRSGRPRSLSVYSWHHLVLGNAPENDGRFVATEIDQRNSALFAWNPMAPAWGDEVVFAAPLVSAAGKARPEDALEAPAVSFTTDRASFLGYGGSPSDPRALRQGGGLREGGALDGDGGGWGDRCFAQQVRMQIPAGGTARVGFLLGEARNRVEALRRIEEARRDGAVAGSAGAMWQDLLSRLHVETPSPAFDLLVNGWLPYQTLSCRIWGRTALYQSGGAFGYRDQIQDAGALLLLRPDLTRRQILLHASHQFAEGDVLHWWHPTLSRGLRTRFADDLLWLPYAAALYVEATGDRAILDEVTPFVGARPLGPGEDEAYLPFTHTGESASVYEHAARAIDRSLVTGAHGLPLFGTGDWNDGMNRVGREGRGESVWMGFFLYEVLGRFAGCCRSRGDGERLARYEAHRERLRAALEATAWDGDWYLRGWYDDGAPLGSRASDECRIDALVQAWSVLSGAADPVRARQAMDAVERHLISEEEGIIRLLAPPFQDTPRDPGYIKGYVAGIRENGGQYTHAALWVVRAMAALGRNDRAARLFDLLNPILHARTAEEVAVYQVEPYVVAADVYGAPPHVGRGGWTWYTGSSGWMYRVAVESILGMRTENGDTLVMRPCIPDAWDGFTIRWKAPGTGGTYRIEVRNRDHNARRVVRAELDGAPALVEEGAARVPILGGSHELTVILGS